MKVFIVFTALFMMAFTCVVYQGDVNKYMHEQETLKIIAEEAACQAAMRIDEEEYGMGRKVFDYSEAETAAAVYVEAGRKLLAEGIKYDISYSMNFEDDLAGYDAENEENIPAVTVSVCAETDDFFRLPFLKKSEITRKSKYEVKGL